MFDVNNDVRIAPNMRVVPQNKAANNDISSPRLPKKYEEQLASGEFMSLEEFHQRMEWLKKYLKEKKQHALQDISSERSVG